MYTSCENHSKEHNLACFSPEGHISAGARSKPHIVAGETENMVYRKVDPETLLGGLWVTFRNRMSASGSDILDGLDSFGRMLDSGMESAGDFIESAGNWIADRGFRTNEQIAINAALAEFGRQTAVDAALANFTPDTYSVIDNSNRDRMNQQLREIFGTDQVYVDASRQDIFGGRMPVIPDDAFSGSNVPPPTPEADEVTRLTNEEQAIKDEFLNDTRATTDARIKALKDAGWDTTQLEGEIQNMRAALANGTFNNPAGMSGLTGAIAGMMAGTVNNPSSGSFAELPNGTMLPVTADDYARGNGITTQYSNAHPGVDISLYENTQIFAEDDGTVILSRWEDPEDHRAGYGQYMVIDYGNGVEKLYGHLNHRNYQVGQRIRPGNVIGLSGSTGLSTGPHLHYGVRVNGRYVNPFTWWR